MAEIADIAYCNKGCLNKNPDGTCKVYGSIDKIPEAVRQGWYCDEWDCGCEP